MVSLLAPKGLELCLVQSLHRYCMRFFMKTGDSGHIRRRIKEHFFPLLESTLEVWKLKSKITKLAESN